ncbi:MAG: winged helix-turn-helix transcriptional regulator [Caldilineales bacterium]|nr:winged helix-turn-helix transcriptional regulator [Caldilineales bacterium]
MPTHFQGDPAQVLALDTFIKLTRAASSVQQTLSQGCTYGDLTVSQFGALETLYHLGPMCQNELGEKLLTSPGNLSLVINNLEKQGLVRRERDSIDRRKVTVVLTETGHALIADLFPAHAAAIAAAVGVLDGAEQQLLGQLCKRLGKGQPS